MPARGFGNPEPDDDAPISLGAAVPTRQIRPGGKRHRPACGGEEG